MRVDPADRQVFAPGSAGEVALLFRTISLRLGAVRLAGECNPGGRDDAQPGPAVSRICEPVHIPAPVRPARPGTSAASAQPRGPVVVVARAPVVDAIRDALRAEHAAPARQDSPMISQRPEPDREDHEAPSAARRVCQPSPSPGRKCSGEEIVEVVVPVAAARSATGRRCRSCRSRAGRRPGAGTGIATALKAPMEAPAVTISMSRDAQSLRISGTTSW